MSQPTVIDTQGSTVDLIENSEGFERNYGWKVFTSISNSLARLLIGSTVFVSLWYGFRQSPLNATQEHVIFCVVGYQFLMAEAILCFTSGNGWSVPLKLKHKKLAHWMLQVLGSVLVITGTIRMSLSRPAGNYLTVHGQLGLAAMVFATVSLVNGLASLYAYELRKILPGTITKLGHILLGITCLVLANCTLTLGFDKNGFRTWSGDAIAETLMAFVAIFTIILFINPAISFWKKLN